MTTKLLVLQFVDAGKLTVEDAVKLLETLADEEVIEPEYASAWGNTSPITFFIIQEK